ncbi:TauD/TfdA family dioxygenase [Roseovarius sp. A21]|uniref:TauD/TfdA family dioxygenase n=1 Tax=Roseovarius bejariae TaxID=2576383 RepID=A0A844CYP0_9RHOB|nr:TauD/TfdA family dioxygenase [Roseovarius bejariae]MRU14753.1 TauD/TfdA family dioxygenase [Roseovarius bejariae]
MTYNIIRPDHEGQSPCDIAIQGRIRRDLDKDGWTLLRGFRPDMAGFSALTTALCNKITFDPAREYGDANTQKVDAGTGPIGLHTENGNTPVCPDIVAFFSPVAAFEGSQTTVCDGRAVFEAMDDETKARWQQPMVVERYLPEELWKRYLANEHPAISRPEEVTEQHVEEFRAAIPNQEFDMLEDGGINYRLTVSPVRGSALSGGQGFANAVLGPSHNYAPPRYRFAEGEEIEQDEIEALRDLAETCTHEINWQDGDIAVLDNTRVMHGRRAIVDNNRQLFIGMGNL